MFRTLVGFDVVGIHWAIDLVAKHDSSCDGWHFTSVLNALQCGASMSERTCRKRSKASKGVCS